MPATDTSTAPERRVSMHRILLLIAAQGLICLVLRQSTVLATLFALAIAGFGVFALMRRDLLRIVQVAAYASGIELVFRITDARVFYEFGKYLVAFLLAGAFMTILRHVRGIALPAIILAGVLPSAMVTISAVGVSRAREPISAVTTGVVVLTLAVALLSNLRTTAGAFERVAWTMVIAISGTASLATFGTLTTDVIDFGNQSTFVTSAGYGPVQVSALLAAGSLLCLILASSQRSGSVLIPLTLSIWFSVQSVLTFSRGGLATLLIATSVFLVHRFWHARGRGQAVLVFGLIIAAVLLVVPRLEQLTSGAVEERFSDVETGRAKLAAEDIEIFLENPLTGVGPGRSRDVRLHLTGASSHTEYTRLLAEHGLFGLGALVALILLSARIYLRSNRDHRPVAAALLAWSLSHMAYGNLRIAAAAFLFGLASLQVDRGPTTPAPAQARTVSVSA